jgi:hypothetical protein
VDRLLYTNPACSSANASLIASKQTLQVNVAMQLKQLNVQQVGSVTCILP